MCGACQPRPSKGEAKSLHQAPPVAKKEAQSLVGLSGLGGATGASFGGLFWPRVAQWNGHSDPIFLIPEN